MNKVLGFIKSLDFSSFWVRNGIAIITIALVGSHLTDRENFPLSENYSFPWFTVLVSLLIGVLILIVSKLNFDHFKVKYFVHKITAPLLVRFLLSTLGYITVVYICLYFSLVILNYGTFNLYGLVSGLSVTLLLSTVCIGAILSPEIYRLHKLNAIQGKLKVQQSGKITLVPYAEIAYLYSEHKTVFLVKMDGTSLVTDFTLNEIEQEVSQQSFFRANRQTILHPQSVEEVKSIENGKLTILLKPALKGKAVPQITISRYKKQAFMDWFQHKL